MTHPHPANRRLEHSGDARPAGRNTGQASVELVAILPALAVCVLIAAHGLSAGWALWSAANAARAGARAEHVGGNGEAVARRALPGPLAGGARVRVADEVRVEVRAPALLPGAEPGRLAAESALDPEDD